MQIQQLENCLEDQFVVRRALEQALQHKSSAIDTSADTFIPKVSSSTHQSHILLPGLDFN